jgi:hypothetical protein
MKEIIGIKKVENWYLHILQAVCKHEDITILWNQGIQTDLFWPTSQTQ